MTKDAYVNRVSAVMLFCTGELKQGNFNAAVSLREGNREVRLLLVDAISEQADEIYRLRVLRARETPPLTRMWEGVSLFEMASRISRAGAEQQAAPGQGEVEYQRRLKISRLLSQQPHP